MEPTATTGDKRFEREARPSQLEAGTLCEAFQQTASERASQVGLRAMNSDVEITYGEWNEHLGKLAAGFASLGISRGDTVGFMLTNRPEFLIADTAAMHLGATCFSIYNTSAPEQIEYLVTDAANSVVVTEQAFLPQVTEAASRVDTLKHIVVVDGDAPEGGMTLDQLAESGAGDFDLDAAWRAVEPSDVLCLIYTSGTTGPPKGVELTHDNLMSVWRSVDQIYPSTPGGRSISFLPSAHIADRWANLYAAPVYGHTICCCADPRAMVMYTPQVRPTVWGGVPRIWEKLKTALELGFEAEQDADRKKAIQWALDVGRKRVRLQQAGEEIPADLAEEAAKADALVGAKVREQLGIDQAEWFAVGAAPTPPEVLEFFAALGIEIAEIWGMSETSALATINPPGAVRFGTVGPPIPGVEIKLAEDGEILVRGPNIMRGYRNQPEKTKETIDEDGWLYTGDVGEFDDAGYLKIVDRKKELIINAAGKNMSPANIEAKLKSASPLIGQAVAIGDRRPYNVALIVLDPDAAGMFGQQAGIEDPSAEKVAKDERLLEQIKDAVERANADLSRVEQIKRFTVLPTEWQPGGDELTPTMKLKRKPISQKYEEEIEALYES